MMTPRLTALLFAAGQTLAMASQQADNAGQVILDEQRPWTPSRSQKVAPTLTVNVEGSASATHTAEVAELHIMVSAQNATESAASASWAAAAQQVSEYLQSRPSIMKFDSTSSRTIAGDGGRFSQSKRPKDDSHDDDESTGPTVMNRFTGRLSLPGNVDTLARELQSIANVRVQWIDWDLLEETKAEAKMSVKTAAIRNCFDMAQRYSDMLGTGYETMELAEVDEQYSYFEPREQYSRKGRYYYGGDDEGDWEPRDVYAVTEVKCRVRIF